MASTRYCTCRPTHCRRGDAIEGAHREAVTAALECIAAVDDVARAGVNYAGGGDAERRATIGDARGRATRTSHRRAHARRIRCRRATSPRRATWYVGIVGRAAHVDHGVRVRRREHERFALTCASVHGAGFRRYGSERIVLSPRGRWALRVRGLKAEFVMVLLPGVLDGRPVRTASAPFLLNADCRAWRAGGGMGHGQYRRREEYMTDCHME